MGFQPSMILSARSMQLLKELEKKDVYTYQHSAQVAEYAVNLGKAMELGQAAIRELYIAGWLQDIGKLLLPNEILHKPTRLNDSEYALVKNHPVHSAALIHQEGYSPTVLEGILSHHERWDGKGYPCGLGGMQIPLSGRILQIVDSFSAMTTTRSYRAGMDVEEAIKQLTVHATKQFDASIVSMFIKRVIKKQASHLPHALR